MKLSIALRIFRDYQKANLKSSTVMGYRYLIDNFEGLFGEKDLKSINSEDIYNYQQELTNPLDSPFMWKMFPLPKPKHRAFVSKAIIDEVVFSRQGPRDRLILKLQSRYGARIGEVLNIRIWDIEGRNFIVHNPKSGKEKEPIFMLEQVIGRLKAYLQEKGLSEQEEYLTFPLPSLVR